ncbi:MAG TPA: acetyl-CoA carboxylase, carboxyltransferase subunit beta [Tepidisphaeraceae bacterium]|jgi:acetyl-CoA carboxylase carboxyl transferase subunit beta|nr:acetyl-CoA carboxylase, carboxyltransferase subunit beta [Tepidisphaeraceae bacterium]
MSQAPNEGLRLQKEGIPEGLWMRCPECGDMLFRKVVEEALHVCPGCQHHFRLSARRRIDLIVDLGTFEERYADVSPTDPLEFVDKKSYADRLKSEQEKTGNNDAVVCGKGFIKGRPIMMAVMDPTFMMGSMGSVVGEKITRTIEAAAEEQIPLLIVSCSGGARMQESSLSLMQMAKTSAALGRLDDVGGVFISLLADPTTGGVTASFAMLGDFIIAEPKALIGFAGPRTIWNTIRVELPEGFQRSEFLQEKGFIDFVVHRKDLRSELARLVDFCGK